MWGVSFFGYRAGGEEEIPARVLSVEETCHARTKALREVGVSAHELERREQAAPAEILAKAPIAGHDLDELFQAVFRTAVQHAARAEQIARLEIVRIFGDAPLQRLQRRRVL